MSRQTLPTLQPRHTAAVQRATAAIKESRANTELIRRLNTKLQEQFEDELTAALVPMFEAQIKSAAKRLKLLGDERKAWLEGKAFCPTGPGGGIDNSCGGPGGGGSNLTSAEREAVSNWSHMLYRESSSSKISPEYAGQLRDLQSALDKLPDYKGTVHRAMVMRKGQELEDVQGGLKREGVYVPSRPVSTSKSGSLASEEFGELAAGPKDTVVVFEMKARTAADVSKLVSEEYHRQEEVIVKPGSAFVIEKVSRSKGPHGGKQINVTMEERSMNTVIRDRYYDKIGYEGPSSKATQPALGLRLTSEGITSQIFDPREWNEELINRSLPVIANGMSKAMRLQLRVMGIDTSSLKQMADFTKSTATEWLESYEDIGETLFETPMGAYNIIHATEYPQWMKQAIEDRLRESFAQDYWAKVNLTTLGDIDNFLVTGLKEGWSIAQMAKEMAPNLLEEGVYATRRGKLIARTEMGNSLNGARSAAMDSLINEVGEQLPMKKTWLSVLGTTTRDTHANLDGVPADKDGTWELGGVRCRWPGDVVLPPRERCNCFPGFVGVKGSFVGAQRVWYEGILTEIVTRRGVRLSVTPNHPIATSEGFVPASQIKPSDQVLVYDSQIKTTSKSPTGLPLIGGSLNTDQVQHKPIAIEQVFETFLAGNGGLSPYSGGVEVLRSKVDDFYGDGLFCKGDIDVVRTNWKLLEDGVFEGGEKRGDSVFSSIDPDLISESSLSSGGLSCDGVDVSSSASVGLMEPPVGVFIGRVSPSGALTIGVTSDFNTRLSNVHCQSRSQVSELLRESLERNALPVQVDDLIDVRDDRSFSGFIGASEFDPSLHECPPEDAQSIRSGVDDNLKRIIPGEVSLDEVVEVRNDRWFSGHVYDLQGENGLIVANNDTESNIGIVSSNCQCSIVISYGMTDTEATTLLGEYQSRLAEQGKSLLMTMRSVKAFCPTGPGGGIDNSCGGPGGGSSHKPLSDGEVDELKPNWKKMPDGAKRQQAVADYMEDGWYQEINGELRKGGTEWAYGENQRMIRHITRAISEDGPRLSKDTTLYRAIGKNTASRFKEGETFMDEGFLSTTSDPKIGAAIQKELGNDAVLIEIRVKAGTRVIAPLGATGAKEVIMNRGSSFNVISTGEGRAVMEYLR